MSINPTTLFSDFYENRAINALRRAKFWTVSGKLDEDSKGKAPIDMRHLLDVGRVRGAWARDARCLVDLDELTLRLPDASNVAYYLDSLTDGLMVLDIEPGCPQEIAHNLLALPGALYTETSMSGRGYHMVFAKPKNFHDHPAAQTKKVIREEHGWYEILLEHWVTFTRRPVLEAMMSRASEIDLAAAKFGTFEELYASLAKTAKVTPTVATQVGNLGTETPKIAGMGSIIRNTITGAESRLRSLDDFGGDRSRFEFSVLGTLYRQMTIHMVVVGNQRNVTYSLNDRAWLLFLAAQEVLPRRAKHNERRNGRPFLLDRAASMVAQHTNTSHSNDQKGVLA